MAKRAKRWYRPRNLVLLFLVLAFAWLGWGVYSAVTAKPGRAVDYGRKMHELTASYQPGTEADPNAWDSFLAAVDILARVDREFKAAVGAGEEVPEGWPSSFRFPYDFSAVREATAPDNVVEPTLRVMDLLRAAGLHEKLSEMAAQPRAVRGRQEGRLIEVLLPELGKARELARLCAARMYLAHGAGDETEQIEAFEHLLALGRVLASQPLLIDRLVGIAIISTALTELRSEMTEEPLTPEMCRAVLAAIERQLAGMPPIALQLEGERLMVLDTVQWTHTDDGRGSGRLLLSEVGKVQSEFGLEGGGMMRHPIANAAGILFPSKREVEAKVNDLFDRIQAYAAASHAERASMGSPDLMAEQLPRSYMLLRILLPAWGKAISSDEQLRMELDGTRLLLALRLYEIDHGNPPERLEDLVPSLLRTMPIDPVCGKAYGYRRLAPEEDPNGWGGIVYSLGMDGEDNGGVEHPQGKFNALRPEGKGYDFLINTARGR